MPDESCRNCGGALIDYSKCPQCNKIIKMICALCGTVTLEKVHSLCMSYEILTNRTMLINKSDDSFLATLA